MGQVGVGVVRPQRISCITLSNRQNVHHFSHRILVLVQVFWLEMWKYEEQELSKRIRRLAVWLCRPGRTKSDHLWKAEPSKLIECRFCVTLHQFHFHFCGLWMVSNAAPPVSADVR